MDETDLIMIQQLLVNSRLPYRELADKLNLSVNAVHKRIQGLSDSGVIRTFTARISIAALRAISITVFGRSEATSMDAIDKKLEKNEFTYWFSAAGGNYVYVGAHLRSLSDLEPFVAYLKKEAQIKDPTVGISSGELSEASKTGKESPLDVPLSTLDYRIIHALHKNSRRPVSDVAEELGVSAKTVRRRLSRMIEEGLIELSLEWYPDASNDIMTIFHLHLKDTSDKGKVLPVLLNEYSPSFMFLMPFSNLPNLILYVIWTNTMKELREIQESIDGEEFIESTVPNILYSGSIYDTWRDDIVLKKGAPPNRGAD